MASIWRVGGELMFDIAIKILAVMVLAEAMILLGIMIYREIKGE